jgi:hypothetical protein
VALADLLGGVDTRRAEGGWHPDVSNDHLGLEAGAQARHQQVTPNTGEVASNAITQAAPMRHWS